MISSISGGFAGQASVITESQDVTESASSGLNERIPLIDNLLMDAMIMLAIWVNTEMTLRSNVGCGCESFLLYDNVSVSG